MRDTPPKNHTTLSRCCSRKVKESFNGSGGRVTYTLGVSLWIGEQVVATHAEEIVWSPSKYLSPPICVQDFPRDYKTSQINVSKNIFTKARRVLRLSVTEPGPLEYNPSTGKLQTKLHFTITCEDTILPSTKYNSLTTTRCEVKTGLKAKTIISLNPLQAQPTTSQVRCLPYLSEMIKEYESKSRTLKLPAWKEIRRDQSGGNVGMLRLNFWIKYF